MSILENLQDNPMAIKNLSIDELRLLASEIRQVILDTVLINGGHLASSLGVVEVIIALHYVFDASCDKFIFDVGHQCYAHKLLTGRLFKFSTLRQKDGIAGFPKRTESVYDAANTGHSSTAISLGTAFAKARALKGAGFEVVSIVGDGAMTGGLCYEALNYSSESNEKQIIILNDNEMSISRNVGSTAKYLLRLHGNSVYRRFKTNVSNIVDGFNLSQQSRKTHFLSNLRNSVKYFIQRGMPFEQYGYKYLGPINGHDLASLIEVFKIARNEDDSVILHIITKKGKGFVSAEQNPAKYHGYSVPKIECAPNFSTVFGNHLTSIAQNNDKVVALTAAMVEGTGLAPFAQALPDRLIDVGIAEAQGACMASGLAIEGFKPYFAVYSSFMQRAFDQAIHDIALQNLPVTFCLDRSGLVPSDGETHQGIYDISYLRAVPKMAIVAPCDTNQLKKILDWSITYQNPLSIKYPKGEFCDVNNDSSPFILGKWNYLEKREKADSVLLCAGALMVAEGIKAARILEKVGVFIDIVNASSIKPLDINFLNSIADKKIFTAEDNTINGGFGSAVVQYFCTTGTAASINIFAISEDECLTHASIAQLLLLCQLDAQSIADKIIKKIKN